MLQNLQCFCIESIQTEMYILAFWQTWFNKKDWWKGLTTPVPLPVTGKEKKLNTLEIAETFF